MPSHFKRFSIKMFTFTKDDEVLKDEVTAKSSLLDICDSRQPCILNPPVPPQIYVHCDALICDTNSQADGACSGQCVNPPDVNNSKFQGKGVKRGEHGLISIFKVTPVLL